MGSDSLTPSWPMNSDRRWGRSESSTTLSSGMISGVVTSARDISAVNNELGLSCEASPIARMYPNTHRTSRVIINSEARLMAPQLVPSILALEFLAHPESLRRRSMQQLHSRLNEDH